MSGALRSHYNLRPQVMSIAALNLTTPHTHLNASGTLGATSEDLKVDFTATSLTELEPFVLALGYAPSPVELSGKPTSMARSVAGCRTPRLRATFRLRTSLTHTRRWRRRRNARPIHRSKPKILPAHRDGAGNTSAGSSQTNSHRSVLRRRAVLAFQGGRPPRRYSGRQHSPQRRLDSRAGERATLRMALSSSFRGPFTMQT